MSKYTTEVRYICETAAGLVESKGYNSINDILEAAREKVFDFDYPIFDEKYRPTIETKILRHYYTREICEETVGLWKLRLEDKMNVIMPYYNQLYKSELIKFNPLYNVELSTAHSGKKDNSATVNEDNVNSSVGKKSKDAQENIGSVNDTVNNKTGDMSENTATHDTSVNSNVSNNVDKYSDTPQGAVPFNDVSGNIYLTNARIVDNAANNTGENTGSVDSSQKTQNTEVGKEVGNVDKTLTDVENDVRNDVNSKRGSNVITGTDSYVHSVVGKHGGESMSKMLKEFRSTFLNIDEMVIEELSDLFFGLW